MLMRFMEQLSEVVSRGAPFPVNNDGSYTLVLRGQQEISLRENPNSGITISTSLGQVSQGQAELAFTRLMEANLLARETGGSVLGLDKESKQIIFSRAVLTGSEFKEFYEAFESFANYAEGWRDEVSTWATGEGV